MLEPMLRSPCWHDDELRARLSALLHALRLWAETPPEGWPVDGRREASGAACLEGSEAPPHVDHRPAGALDREQRGREQRDARHVDSAEVAQLVRVRVRVRVALGLGLGLGFGLGLGLGLGLRLELGVGVGLGLGLELGLGLRLGLAHRHVSGTPVPQAAWARVAPG